MWRARGKSDKIQLSFKYRIYPTREEKLLRVMQVEAKVYNALLDIVNNARKEGRRMTPKDTQDMLKDLKIEGKELVYSKVLQMVNNQLWYNINSLHELKKRGRRVGKLRYKKIMKTINYNQSGFRVVGDKTNSLKDRGDESALPQTVRRRDKRGNNKEECNWMVCYLPG